MLSHICFYRLDSRHRFGCSKGWKLYHCLPLTQSCLSYLRLRLFKSALCRLLSTQLLCNGPAASSPLDTECLINARFSLSTFYSINLLRVLVIFRMKTSPNTELPNGEFRRNWMDSNPRYSGPNTATKSARLPLTSFTYWAWARDLLFSFCTIKIKRFLLLVKESLPPCVL